MAVLNIVQRRSATDASVLELGDDLLLQICSHLSSCDLVALRKTCRYLSTISRSRYLWHNILRRDVTQEHRPIPAYRKPTYELGTPELEALIHRSLGLDTPCRQPTIARLDSKQSVNWVRLVHGQWLLAAFASPQGTFSMVLYSLTQTEGGKPTQVAISQLPGPVSSGEVEVQQEQLVIALCFQSPRRMTEVFSVQRRDESIEFAKLATLPGLSHVRCLRNELLGCGAYCETRSPCVANWKTGEVRLLPTASDTPAQVLTMALREDICVVISPSSLAIYALSRTSRIRAEPLQVIKFDHYVGSVSTSAEREALPPLDESSEQAPTRMLLFTATSVSITVLRLRQLDPVAFSLEVVAESELKRGDVLSARPSLPHFGGSSSRLSWLYAPTSFFDRTSSLVTGRFVPRDASSPSSGAKFEIVSECKDTKLPSLHAMPVMDYDDGAGIVVVGNACGELAVCNYAGPISSDLARCFRAIPIPRVPVSAV